MNDFSNWFDIESEPEYGGPAVYEFRLICDHRPAPIGRLLALDRNGVLVIGCTGHLARRCYQSRSGRRRASGSSTMNWLYYLERNPAYREVFRRAEYQYRFSMAESIAEAKVCEEQRLKAYWRQFGEAPPLNSIIPNRYGEYGEIVVTAVEMV